MGFWCAHSPGRKPSSLAESSLRHGGEAAAVHEQGVRGQDAGAAGVGDDGEVGAFGPGLLGEHLGHVKDLRQIPHPQHAAAPEGGVQHIVADRELARVGDRGPGRGLRAPGFDHDDGLGEGDLPGRGEEAAGVADVFHVDHDGLGAGVFAQIVDQIPPVQIQHGAHGDQGAEAHILPEAPVQHRAHQRAALAEEAHAAGPGHALGKGGVEAADRVHQPQAVGPQNAQIAPARPDHHLLLQAAALGPGLLEALGHHHGRLHPGGHTLLHQIRHGRGGGDQNRQIDGVRHGLDGGVGAHAQHIGPLGVDRIDRAAKGAADQVPQDGAAHTLRPLRGPDHRHGLGLEERVQGVGRGLEAEGKLFDLHGVSPGWGVKLGGLGWRNCRVIIARIGGLGSGQWVGLGA